MPARIEEEKVIVRARYLDDEVLEIPAMALQRIRLEIGHMGEITNDMLRLLGSAFSDRDLERFQAVRKMDDKVDILQGVILNYMG